MDGPGKEPRRILAALERRLSELERGGVRWLSVAAAGGGPEPGAPATAPADDAPPPGPDRARPPHPPAAAPAGDGERPPPSALETLDALRLAFRDCRNCKLSPTRTNVVFGVGQERPRLMFIGEGPGADEDAQGLPFVGRAGALLTGLIRAMGLVREDVYITNVVKCRPPGNRNPEPDEIDRCRPILQRQIELLRPRLIVTLGNVPLKALKPHAAGITREHGTPFRYGEWEVLPTFHPSYLLRNPAAIETCWEDFRKALRMAYSET